MIQELIFITELDNFGSLWLRLLVENTECCVLLSYAYWTITKGR